MSENENSIYINRELSWLGFNERVLQEAEDENVPLLERLKFVSIFASNLDEFFMVRIGSLYDQSIFHPELLENKCNMSALEQITAVCREVRPLLDRKDVCFKTIIKALGDAGIRKINFSKISPQNESKLRKYFKNEIVPLLSPQLIDKHHPFPFLKNKELYVAVQMESKSETLKLGLVPVDSHFERVIFINTNKGLYFALAEELIYHFAHDIFKKYTFIDKWLFRITRNADIDANEALVDQDMDWRDVMQELIKERRRLAAIRLQTNKPLSEGIVKYFCTKLKIEPYQIFTESSPFDISFAFDMAQRFAKTNPGLVFDNLSPTRTTALKKGDSIIEYVKQRDLLLSYPYHSIKTFIDLLEEAASDPDVTSIKITLYRVAKNSQILSALLHAVENGKEVTAVLELRARFDEQNNIDWSKQLESAGCNILYGLDDFKVHSKLLLITRNVDGNQEYITQIGTGNYNEKTAVLYTDLCVITANQEIGAEAQSVFNSLMMGTTIKKTKHLLIAPNCFSPKIYDLIDEQIRIASMGGEGIIKIKCNSVTDKKIIDKLLVASKAGVKIQMIVRGICCFKAGVPGESENICVKSIVGRLLEHSRIYIFGSGEKSEVYISSADLMTRNTHRRVEVAAPVYDSVSKQTLIDMFDVMYKDNVKTRIMLADGTYERAEAGEGDELLDSQRYFYKMFAEQVFEPIRKTETKKQAKAAKTSNKKTDQTQTDTQTKKPGFFKRLWRKLCKK